VQVSTTAAFNNTFFERREQHIKYAYASGIKVILLLLILPAASLFSCVKKKALFTELPAAHTGITFSNRITENDSINILENEYVYNGGGVAISDFNNDGLQDIYFTGNMVSNKLYLNKGQMQFEDVTALSGVNGSGRWCSGIAIVDINNDGLQDIYVCATLKNNAADRKNLLYINKGMDKNGIPSFKEMAAEYGIADTTHSTNAVFFDYDRDGDLDLYVLVDKIDEARFPNKYHYKITDGTAPGTDHLYRNDWNDYLHHPVFTDVSEQAGITIEGFGLGVHVSDINKDGWPDIYVTNDYISNDLLYINNKNGTFTNKAADYFKHTSFSAMGNDIADINNDGLQDIIAVDMLPEDNLRKKMMLNPNNYSSYLNTKEFNYEYQYVRNTLQLNLGNRPGADSVSHPIFADIAFYANVAATDWSWTPLVADFDNDGFRDVVITNGFPRDVTDRDFISYRANTKNYAANSLLLDEIPAVKLKNYAFHNNGNLTFSNVSDEWGITHPTFSNGAAYADLDNDGDLDYVVNNINDSASLFKNNINEQKNYAHNYIRLVLKGDTANAAATGAFADIRYGNKQQVHEQTPYRGYLSTMEHCIHFGLGQDSIVDEIKITWPDGKEQFLKSIKVNQVLTIKKEKGLSEKKTDTGEKKYLFTDVTKRTGINYIHQDKDYIDFNVQKLLTHKFSQYGPAMAVGDVNGDGLDDFFISGSYGNSGSFFMQQKDGRFADKKVNLSADINTKKTDDAGVLLFDADGDKDLDLYIAGGGFENPVGSENYKDRFYINDGNGNFSIDSFAMPNAAISKSCVKAADYDKDGDLDLFIGGRVLPGKYPMPVASYILRNDSKNGKPLFTDVTKAIAPALNNIGLTCDMLWTDYDNDSWPDIMIAGEWMPITILKNKNGRFENIAASTGLNKATGWWNSLAAGDFDNDGDIDYVAGNAGLNSFYKASPAYPANIYGFDYNNDGGYDAIPSVFLPDINNKLQEFPAFGRDDMIKQMIGFRARFTNYKQYATATIAEVLTTKEIKKSLHLQVNNLSSCFIKNMGDGHFELQPLPVAAQLSSIFGMLADDVDADGNLDIIINGNDYSTEISTGRYDAFSGLILKGDGKGNFMPLQPGQSGFYMPGDGKSLVYIKAVSDKPLLLAAQNQGLLAVFENTAAQKIVNLNADDVNVVYKYVNGQQRKEELYFGNSFYSQSGRYIMAGSVVQSVTITDGKGNKRIINL
jgi:enediyne biosynthesis protein E4